VTAAPVRYVLLIYRNERDEQDSSAGAYDVAELGSGSGVLGDHRLAANHATTTVRTTTGGPLVQDGPFASTGVPLSRLCVVDLPDLDDALSTAERLAGWAAAVEIRPLRAVR